MKLLSRWSAVLLLLGACALAQTTPVQVRTKLIDGTGNLLRSGFLHFELGNCGPNFPLVTSGTTTVAKTQFDLTPNQPNGSILGQVIGYDQILCGGIASTQYNVTVMKDANTPSGPTKHYLLCSTSKPPDAQCSNQVAGIFDLATAQPMDQPVQPGHVQLFGNPTKDQLWIQPTGTKATLKGTFDVTNVNWIGLPTGGGGGGGITSVTGIGPLSFTVGSAPVGSITKADATHDGYIASNDWNIFNSKGIGSVLSVGITVPQGLAIAGCPITGSGVCAISLNGQFPVSSLGTGAPNSTNFLSGSGAWAPAVTFGGLPVLGLAQGTNTLFTLNSSVLTIASTSAVTYPILAPDGDATHPQVSFLLHPEIGYAAVLVGAELPIRSVQVTGPTGPNNIIVTLSSPINPLRWAVGDTFQFKALPVTNALNTLNGITFTATAVGQTTPTGTVTFSATTSIATATYTPTAGSASNWAGSLDGHTWLANRIQSTTTNPSRTGTVQGARRDAWKYRCGAIDDSGIDCAALRGGIAMSPTVGVGVGFMASSGTNNSGASSITVAKGVGADWPAKNGDFIVIDQANGDADTQMYMVTSDTTVAQGTTTSLPISPALRTNISAGRLIVASWSPTQLGDATGAEVLGVFYLKDTANYPDGCLMVTAATGIVSSTGSACGGGGSVAGSDKDIQVNIAGSQGVDTGVFTYNSSTKTVKVANFSVVGATGSQNRVWYTVGAVALTANGAGTSAFGIDIDGFFKVCENNGACVRPGGAGGGDLLKSGSPTSGQTAEFVTDSTHLTGVANTGSGLYVKQTAPSILGGKFDVLNDTSNHAVLTLVATVNAVNAFTFTNAAAGGTPTISVTGADTNISVNIVTKGSGQVLCNGLPCGAGGSSFTNLFQTDANTLTQRNASVTQVYQVMDQYTDATNFQGLAVGGNYVKTIKAGTGNSLALQLGVHGTAFRGWQITTGLDFVPFNTVTAPNVGLAGNRVAGFFGASLDLTGAVTVTVLNETVTGTTVNKLAKLTGNPSKLIITGTSDTDFDGIIVSGAGLTGSAVLARSGVTPCVFDSGTTAGDYVVNSTTVAGDCHDTGSQVPPTSGKAAGRVQSTNVSAGTYSVLVGLEMGGGTGGSSGTVTTLSTSGGAPLFSATVTNPNTTPLIVFALSNFPANTIYANATGSSAAPTTITPLLTGSLFSNQGTNVHHVLHANPAGFLTFGFVDAATELSGNFVVGNFAGGVNATGSTVWCGNMTWCTPAGGGNLSSNGSITVGFAAEWASTTSLRSIATSGSGFYLKQDTPTINTPKMASIKDANGNPALDFITTATAINDVTLTNSATGTGPTVGVQGTDANIDLNLAAKGTGKIKSNGPIQAVGATGYLLGPEGVNPGLATTGQDFLYASSANRYWTMSNNGGPDQKVIGSGADINTLDQVVFLHLAAVRAGDVALFNGTVWTTCAGNNSGTRFLQEDSNGVCSFASGTSSVAWDALLNPSSNKTFAMTGFTSTYSYTSAVANAFAWVNAAAATSGTAQSSPTIGLQGNYWSSSGPSSAPDIWQFQNVVSNGVDATSVLTITHNRTGGLVSSPGWLAIQPTAFSAVEGACTSLGVAGRSVICSDSTLHGLKVFNNGAGTGIPLVGGPTSAVSLNLASFNGTGGGTIGDSGIAQGQVATSVSVIPDGNVVMGSGGVRGLADAGYAANKVVTATTVIVSGNLPRGDGVRGLVDSTVVAAQVNFSAANITTDDLVTGAANSRQVKDSGIAIANVIVLVGTPSNVTGQTTSQTSTVLATAPGAGFYHLKYYADLNTACSTGGNSVSFTFLWTDATGARTVQTGTLSMAQGSLVASGYLSGETPIYVGSGNVTYTSTVAGSCATGTSSYDMHSTLTKG